MKKILVLSSFPAAYRVSVFEGLSDEYDLTVIFGSDSDQNRNKDWFVKNGSLKYYLVSDQNDKAFIEKCYKNLNEFDLILAYDWYQIWTLKFQLKAKIKGIPYVVNCDGAFIKKSFIKDIIKKYFITNAAACFAGGEYAKQYFLHYGADEKNIYIHNFTSLSEKDILDAPYNSNRKSQLRKELGLADKTTILSIGQFIERKGFDILIDAWKYVDYNNAQLVIIGGGQLKTEYERQIKENEIKNIIIMDFVPFDKILDYYKASDAFALATREDIWGLIVNEAMANGIPVLISDKCIAGLELVENGINGFIVPNEHHDWVNILNYIIENPELRAKMGKNGIEKIHDHTISNIIKRHKDVIKEIIRR